MKTTYYLIIFISSVFLSFCNKTQKDKSIVNLSKVCDITYNSEYENFNRYSNMFYHELYENNTEEKKNRINNDFDTLKQSLKFCNFYYQELKLCEKEMLENRVVNYAETNQELIRIKKQYLRHIYATLHQRYYYDKSLQIVLFYITNDFKDYLNFKNLLNEKKTNENIIILNVEKLYSIMLITKVYAFYFTDWDA